MKYIDKLKAQLEMLHNMLDRDLDDTVLEYILDEIKATRYEIAQANFYISAHSD